MKRTGVLLFALVISLAAFACQSQAPVATPTTAPMLTTQTTIMVFFPGQRLMPLGGFRVFPVWVDTLRQAAGGVWPRLLSGAPKT